MCSIPGDRSADQGRERIKHPVSRFKLLQHAITVPVFYRNAFIWQILVKNYRFFDESKPVSARNTVLLHRFLPRDDAANWVGLFDIFSGCTIRKQSDKGKSRSGDASWKRATGSVKGPAVERIRCETASPKGHYSRGDQIIAAANGINSVAVCRRRRASWDSDSGALCLNCPAQIYLPWRKPIFATITIEILEARAVTFQGCCLGRRVTLK